MKERIYWVDYLKAFAMFLVVLGHSGIDESSILKSWIYGFHMPLFVFMSGYFISSPRPIIKELKKDFKTLVVPYLFFSLFLIPFYYVVQRLSGVHISSSMFTYIPSRLLMDDYYHCGPIWFLGALLIIKVSFNSVQAVLQNGGGVQRTFYNTDYYSSSCFRPIQRHSSLFRRFRSIVISLLCGRYIVP